MFFKNYNYEPDWITPATVIPYVIGSRSPDLIVLAPHLI